MAIRLTLIILLILFTSCKTQKENPPSISDYEDEYPLLKECDSISKIAKKDYKRGIKIYDVLGNIEATKFEQFYWDFMLKKYNITIKANVQPTLQEECYSESMNYEIELEYGEDFINQTIKEARIEFEKSN